METRTLALFGLVTFAGACKPPPPATPGEAQSCTEEARICADGSSVGRTGPNCEFARCPTDPDNGLSADPAPAGPDGEISPKPMGTFDPEGPPG